MIGTRLIEIVVGLVVFIIASFAFAWLATFVILLLVPVMVLSGYLRLKALTSYAASTKKNLEQSSKVGVSDAYCIVLSLPLQYQLAVDSINNIRAVASLSLERRFMKEYEEKLQKPYRLV